MELQFNNLPKAITNLQETVNEIKRLLLIKGNELQPETDQLLSISQAGELIKLAVPTIYSYVSRNQIPFSKKGKRLYFSKRELFDWIKQGRRKTISEIEVEANAYLKRKG